VESFMAIKNSEQIYPQSVISSQRPRGPFVGPQPLQIGQPIFGRDDEVRSLVNALISERIVLLLSPSGAGKTSLINAGLIPELAKQGFKVLGNFRVGGAALLPRASRGLFAGNLLHQWNAIMRGKHSVKKNLVKLRLSDLADDLISSAGDQFPVVIIDQFEEVVTSGTKNDLATRYLFEDLGELLEDRRIWALFAMREDYLGGIEPFREFINTGLRERQRLDFLTHPRAVEAITKPIAIFTDNEVTFRSDAATLLAERLSLIRDPTTLALVPGKYVEPVLLQVVCAKIWDKHSTKSTTDPQSYKKLTTKDIPDEKDIGDALGHFYNRVIADVTKRFNLLKAQQVRRWFEEELTDGLMRRQTLNGPTRTDADNEILGMLIDEYIIRPDVRNESIWYELSHDRLVGPIKSANLDERLSSPHARLLKERAEAWASATPNSKDDLLLRGRELYQVSQTYHDDYSSLPAVESQFVETSLLYRRRRSRERFLTYIMAILVVAGLASVYFGKQRALSANKEVSDARTQAKALVDEATKSAGEQMATTRSEELAAVNRVRIAEVGLRQKQLEIAKARKEVLESDRKARDAQKKADEAASNNKQLEERNGAAESLNAIQAEKLKLSELEAQALLATAESRAQTTQALLLTGQDQNGTNTLSVISTLRKLLIQYPRPILDARGFEALSQLIQSRLALRSYDFPGDGTQIGYNSQRNEIVVANYNTINYARITESKDPSVPQVSTDVFLDCRKKMRGFNGLKLGPATATDTEKGCDYFANPTRIAISPDGEHVAAGFGWGEIYIYPREGSPIPVKDFRYAVRQMAYSNDGLHLFASSAAWTFALFDVNPKDRMVYREPWWLLSEITFGHSLPVVTAATFAGKQNELLVLGTEDGMVEVWSARRKRLLSHFRAVKSEISVISLAYDLAHDKLLVGGTDRTIKIWPMTVVFSSSGADTPPPTPDCIDVGQNNYALQTAVSRDGQLYATAEANGDVELWDAADQSHLARMSGHSSSVNTVRFINRSVLVSTDALESTRLWITPSLQTLQNLRKLSDELSAEGGSFAGKGDRVADFPEISSLEKDKALRLLEETENTFMQLMRYRSELGSPAVSNANQISHLY
jgi:hypothetical protein